MDVVMAALPIVLTLGLLPTKLPSWVAPGAGLTAALVIAVAWFATPWSDVGAAFGGGAGTVVEVLAIIGGGILLSRVMDRTGGQQRIAIWLSAGGGPTVSTALLMVTGVVPFLESVTGFGVSVIIGLPLLLALGFTPLRAALLSLLGLTVAPWGSMAPGTLLGAEIAGVPLMDMGLASGAFNIVAFVGGGTLAAIVAGRGSHEVGAHRGALTWKAYSVWAATGFTAGLVQGSVVVLANLLLGTAVAGAVGSLVMAALWAVIISRGKLQPTPWRYLSPYLILLIGTIAGQVIERTLLPNGVGAVLGSPALWSISGALAGVWILAMERHHRWLLPRETGRMWLGTAIPTGLYLLLGYAISGGGLADSLAAALTSLGGGFLFLVPFIGGLGGYITASNTGANSMFGGTQTAAAHALGVEPLWVMGGQNAAAGLGCLTSPARIELAYRLAQPHVREDTPGRTLSRGALLRVTMPFFLACLMIWGFACLLFLPAAG